MSAPWPSGPQRWTPSSPPGWRADAGGWRSCPALSRYHLRPRRLLPMLSRRRRRPRPSRTSCCPVANSLSFRCKVRRRGLVARGMRLRAAVAQAVTSCRRRRRKTRRRHSTTPRPWLRQQPQKLWLRARCRLQWPWTRVPWPTPTRPTRRTSPSRLRLSARRVPKISTSANVAAPPCSGSASSSAGSAARATPDGFRARRPPLPPPPRW
mmetsp:Transcript_53770/g.135787  ORF Transcript_53770/g.135787 Transcript_53770/m.135787 type:complete len:209 (-) Transcript_53770:1693-2319(-)